MPVPAWSLIGRGDGELEKAKAELFPSLSFNALGLWLHFLGSQLYYVHGIKSQGKRKRRK